jgi:hypothetical protein
MYTPRLDLNPRVLRVPIVPGSNPSTNYGDLAGRGVAGIVLEAFGERCTSAAPRFPASAHPPMFLKPSVSVIRACNRTLHY